jgi:hypothetical protein
MFQGAQAFGYFPGLTPLSTSIFRAGSASAEYSKGYSLLKK